ncbi:MAG: type 1 glutamine amidotransferase [Dethiobacteria bacterium]|jgi:CobQ-like glutamine amidotransferase family enzyme
MGGLKLQFVHLYPDLMNFYGDRGNMIALVMRAKWRGFSVDVLDVSVGDKKKITQADCIVMGGGQNVEERRLVHQDILRKSPEIHESAEKGIPILAICGSFQLLGEYYQTAQGEKMEGIGLLDLWTIAGKKRMVGNIVLSAGLGKVEKTIVGFENHIGKTFLGAKTEPFGRVLKGYGNNGRDGKEGAIYKNVLGTYLHGPLLPKNPWLTDYILEKAVNNRYPGMKLKMLNSKFEKMAHQIMLKRLGIKPGRESRNERYY